MELFYQKSFNVMWLVNQCCQVNLFYVQSDGYEKRKLAPRRYFFHCKKVSQFHLMLWCQDFGKHTVSAEARPMYPKLCQNCTLSPNFDTRKFVEISVFYTVFQTAKYQYRWNKGENWPATDEKYNIVNKHTFKWRHMLLV